jgi:DNA-binding response OmpR family regulator
MRILIVDDDIELSTCLADVLIGQGHQVCSAYDGITAVVLAMTAEVDAVVLDLHLPDRSGYEVARALRRLVASEVAIVLLTGDARPELDTADAVGIDLVLNKPVRGNDLARMVEFTRARRQRAIRSVA